MNTERGDSWSEPAAAAYGDFLAARRRWIAEYGLTAAEAREVFGRLRLAG